ncbi:MAG: di-heme oxidoredictase family protein [Sulfurifustis sp.]
MTANQLAFFNQGLTDFAEEEGVGDGLGPRFNLDSCGGCHAQPATGGTSPATNPQVAIATALGAKNTVPSFITSTGPVREARFIKNANGSADGGVHALFVISGRVDDTGSAANCNIAQENFAAQVSNNNVIFRIPTPIFGMGLVESITDAALVANAQANGSAKANLGISPKFNHNGNDGTIARFGWKAQNKSGLLFAGEAYNVEMGITNELFTQERDETASCQFATVPNDIQDTDATTALAATNAIQNFANFQRFSAPPTPVTSYTSSVVGTVSSTSINAGKTVFNNIGCGLCHTPSLTTSSSTTVAALRSKTVNAFSDFAIHDMGPGLADEVVQGQAEADEFRTAPLWGLGQRIFFLHDGRTKNLITAILEHKSAANFVHESSEANDVVNNFIGLSNTDQQNLLNFLRSL